MTDTVTLARNFMNAGNTLDDLEALCGYPVGLPRRTYMDVPATSIKEA
ncbi:hypothetical protein GGE65_004701 [Skermanella aerolata]